MMVLLVLFGQIASPPSVLKGDVSFEHCGIACVYGILKLNGVSRSLAEIETRVRTLHPDAVLSQLTLHQLRTTIESFGLSAASYLSNREPGQIPTPCILYLRPDKVGEKQVGHVILLQSVSKERAEICDFTAGIGRRSISLSELRSFWDGEMIAVSHAAPGLARFIRPAACIIAVSAGFLFCLVRLAGCRTRIPKSAPPVPESDAHASNAPAAQ